MSGEGGGGGGTGVTTGAPTQAPSAHSQGGEQQPPTQAPAPRTPEDDFEEALKKAPLKYRASGKDKSVSSSADLKRLLARVDGTETAAQEAIRIKREAESVRQQVAELARMKPAERIQALHRLGVDPKLMREAFEEEILAQDDEEKAQAKLTPREREYEARLRAAEAEAQRFRESSEAAQREQQEREYVARVEQVGKRLESVAVKALEKSKITPQHAPHFLAAIADRLERSERLGLELDEGEVADAVIQEHGQLADQFYAGLDLDALADRLSAVQVDDPAKPGAKISRLTQLMRHQAAKIRAKLGGGGQPSAPQPIQPRQPTEDKPKSMAELMAAARTFGGGSRI